MASRGSIPPCTHVPTDVPVQLLHVYRAHKVSRSYLHSILSIGGFVHTSLAYRVGAYPDVLLDLIAVGEVDIVPMQLLQETKTGEACLHSQKVLVPVELGHVLRNEEWRYGSYRVPLPNV